jgi:uncharacterized protein (TIGR00369 family)
VTEAVRAPKGTKHLEALQSVVRGEAPGPPIAQLIGFTFAKIELGCSVMELMAEKRHANPMGTLHGGVICDVADAAMGTAMATTLEDDESFTTLDLTVKFFKPIWNAKIRATARVTKRTRSLGLIECEVEDEKGSLVAKVFSSCMVLRGEEARNR